MCAGMFMAILDVQVVATSLPTIRAALDMSEDQVSWIQTAYLIAEIVAIPLTGLLTRVLSMRWLFVTSVSIFTLASAGCAASGSYEALIAWRVLQGFAGGTLIPAVFTAVFLLFPLKHQTIATTLAGVLAVLAPTLGPVVGGWITDAYSWRWLFLINVAPGVAAALVGAATLPRDDADLASARTIDALGVALLAASLAALEIGLKEAPGRGWTSGVVLGLLATSLVCGAAFAGRMLRSRSPVVNLRAFASLRFTVACALSFVLGVGLFGSVYLMPFFLGFVRGHDALAIGKTMLVTGLAQLVAAPVAVMLEKRADPRALSAFGFALFGAGLAMSAFQTPETDFAGMLWPQVVRGLAIMFCLLPPTRLALGHLPPAEVPDASGLFNLMRNLGGAIGLALIDTVIFGRLPALATSLTTKLQAGDAATAAFVGIPPGLLNPAQAPPPGALAMLEPLVRRAAMTTAINEAWAVLAALTLAGLLCLVILALPRRRSQPSLR
ncbi:MFS transporter [Alsobacter metallidurans]|uniref:MFS transporter n=2 Tax=Alsobacter metallidurans TaxID=340221 RepID=A0A917I7Z5_9HYPH|nr:MFS transporter [Alsobacter metallidurans]